MGVDSVGNFKPGNTKMLLAKLLKIGCFLSAIAFVSFALYLQTHRPESPDAANGFIFYMKFSTRPFYISKSESVISSVLSYLFLIFGIFASVFDKASKVKSDS